MSYALLLAVLGAVTYHAAPSSGERELDMGASAYPVELGELRSAKPLSGSVIRIRLRDQANYQAQFLIGGTGFALRGRMLRPIDSSGEVGLNTWLGSHAMARGALDVVFRPFPFATVVSVLDQHGQLLAVAHGPGVKNEGSFTVSGKNTAVEQLYVRPRCEAIPNDTGPPITATLRRPPPGSEVLERKNGLSVVATTPAGLETIYCAGHSVSSVETVLPWKHLDPVYRTERLRPLPEGPIDLASRYFSPSQVASILTRWHERYPEWTRLEQIGRSHQGQGIWALAIGKASASEASRKPAILINGGHHGDELLSVNAALDVAQQLLEPNSPEALNFRESLITWVVPLVNPDGNRHFLEDSTRAGRKNGRDLDRDGTRGLVDGVDLNRNYPHQWSAQCARGCARSTPQSLRYRGPAAGSEPETQAVMALAKQQRFAASISFHMGTVAVIYPRAGQNDPALKTLADSVAKALGRHPNGRPYHTRAPGPAVWGADQEWLYANGTYALLVELYGWPPPLESVERRRVLRSLRPAWRSLSRFAVNRSKDTQKSSTNSK